MCIVCYAMELAYNRGGRLSVCMCVCMWSRGSPPPLGRQRPQFVTSCTAVDRVSSVCMCANVPICMCVCVRLCEIGGGRSNEGESEVRYPFLPQYNLWGAYGGWEDSK